MATSHGSVLAALLRGIWRHNPPDLTTSEDELTQVTPLLLRSGGGALGWHRIRHSSFQLPNWLVPAVLRQWDRCLGAGERERVVRYIASHWRHPMQIFREARERWDMPIAATVALGGAFNAFPRLPFQLGLALAHVPIWCQELGSYVKECRISRAGE
jgi:hypothetical protein